MLRSVLITHVSTSFLKKKNKTSSDREKMIDFIINLMLPRFIERIKFHYSICNSCIFISICIYINVFKYETDYLRNEIHNI